MIDILEQLIALVRESVPVVYRTWPERILKGQEYAVIGRVSRNPILYDSDTQDELITALGYNITVFAPSPEAVDDKITVISENLKNYRIRFNSITSSYNVGADMYAGVCNVSITLDNRGQTYH